MDPMDGALPVDGFVVCAACVAMIGANPILLPLPLPLLLHSPYAAAPLASSPPSRRVAAGMG